MQTGGCSLGGGRVVVFQLEDHLFDPHFLSLNIEGQDTEPFIATQCVPHLSVT